MCKFCSLDNLSLDNFDSFFQGACTQGYKSMVCKSCSRTFLTEFVLVQSATGESLRLGHSQARESGKVLIPADAPV